MENKTLSPKNANTQLKLNSLSVDNKSFGNTDLIVEEDSVTIFPEKLVTRNWVSIPKKDFNRMIAWYLKEQKLRA
jgi:hypothetical protein